MMTEKKKRPPGSQQNMGRSLRLEQEIYMYRRPRRPSARALYFFAGPRFCWSLGNLSSLRVWRRPPPLVVFDRC
jgi:hypothetical protein